MVPDKLLYSQAEKEEALKLLGTLGLLSKRLEDLVRRNDEFISKSQGGKKIDIKAWEEVTNQIQALIQDIQKCGDELDRKVTQRFAEIEAQIDKDIKQYKAGDPIPDHIRDQVLSAKLTAIAMAKQFSSGADVMVPRLVADMKRRAFGDMSPEKQREQHEEVSRACGTALKNLSAADAGLGVAKSEIVKQQAISAMRVVQAVEAYRNSFSYKYFGKILSWITGRTKEQDSKRLAESKGLLESIQKDHKAEYDAAKQETQKETNFFRRR